MIHPSIPPEEILKKCSLVITVTGTAGMEALFYQKPVITFSDNFYSFLPSVKRIRNFNELPKTIKASLNSQPTIDDLIKLVDLIEYNTFESNETGMAADFSYRFGFKGPLMDSKLPNLMVKKFLEDYRSEFDKMTEEHLKKIKQYKNNIFN